MWQCGFCGNSNFPTCNICQSCSRQASAVVMSSAATSARGGAVSASSSNNAMFGQAPAGAGSSQHVPQPLVTLCSCGPQSYNNNNRCLRCGGIIQTQQAPMQSAQASMLFQHSTQTPPNTKLCSLCKQAPVSVDNKCRDCTIAVLVTSMDLEFAASSGDGDADGHNPDNFHNPASASTSSLSAPSAPAQRCPYCDSFSHPLVPDGNFSLQCPALKVMYLLSQQGDGNGYKPRELHGVTPAVTASMGWREGNQGFINHYYRTEIFNKLLTLGGPNYLTECRCNIGGCTVDFSQPQPPPAQAAQETPLPQKKVNHFFYSHLLGRKHSCTLCGIAFARSIHLETHNRKHTGEKPFKCTQCGATFTQEGNLETHKRTHTGEKPFKCTQCGAMFAAGGALARHERTHAGDKLFECKPCGRAFTRIFDLKRHMLTPSHKKKSV